MTKVPEEIKNGAKCASCGCLFWEHREFDDVEAGEKPSKVGCFRHEDCNMYAYEREPGKFGTWTVLFGWWTIE